MSAYPLAPEVPPQSAAARRVGFDRTATNVGQYTAAAGSSKFGPIRDQMTPAASTVYTQGSPPGPFATTSMTHDIIYVQPQGADSVEDAGAVLREGNVTQFILPHQGIVRNCFLCLPMADWTNGLVASIPTAYQKSMEDAMGYSGKPSSGNKAVRSWGFGDAPKFDQRQTSGSAAHKSSAYALTTLRVAFNDGMKDNYTSIDSVATTQSLTVGQTFKESDPATGLQRDKPYYFTSLYAPPVQGSAASKNTNEVQPLVSADTAIDGGVLRAGSFTGVPAIVHSQLMKLRSKTQDERMQISFDVENEGVAKSSQVLHDVEEFGFVQLEPADGHALQVRKERNVRRENRPTSDASTARHPQPPRNRENRQNRTVDARRNSSSSSAPSSGSRRATSRRPQPPRSRENRQNRTPRRLQPPPLPPGASTPGETAPSSATAK